MQQRAQECGARNFGSKFTPTKTAMVHAMRGYYSFLVLGWQEAKKDVWITNLSPNGLVVAQEGYFLRYFVDFWPKLI
jgi:hypothetical protein